MSLRDAPRTSIHCAVCAAGVLQPSHRIACPLPNTHPLTLPPPLLAAHSLPSPAKALRRCTPRHLPSTLLCNRHKQPAICPTAAELLQVHTCASTHIHANVSPVRSVPVTHSVHDDAISKSRHSCLQEGYSTCSCCHVGDEWPCAPNMHGQHHFFTQQHAAHMKHGLAHAQTTPKHLALRSAKDTEGT
jgi:hypothetical protein